MTTSSRKSYNENALRGGTTDDMEYVETWGLDPALAYTPKINEAMADLVMQQNIDAGKDPAEMKKKRDMHVKALAKLARK